MVWMLGLSFGKLWLVVEEKIVGIYKYRYGIGL